MDHRVSDGAEAARLLKKLPTVPLRHQCDVAEFLENPVRRLV